MTGVRRGNRRVHRRARRRRADDALIGCSICRRRRDRLSITDTVEALLTARGPERSRPFWSRRAATSTTRRPVLARASNPLGHGEISEADEVVQGSSRCFQTPAIKAQGRRRRRPGGHASAIDQLRKAPRPGLRAWVGDALGELGASSRGASSALDSEAMDQEPRAKRLPATTQITSCRAKRRRARTRRRGPRRRRPAYSDGEPRVRRRGRPRRRSRRRDRHRRQRRGIPGELPQPPTAPSSTAATRRSPTASTRHRPGAGPIDLRGAVVSRRCLTRAWDPRAATARDG